MSDPNYPPPVPRKRGGCMFYGCMTFIVLLVLACVLGFFGLRYAKSVFLASTDSAAMQLPKVDISDAEFQQLQQRVKAFSDGMDQGKAVEPLILTEREINALIVKSPNSKDLAGKVYFALKGDDVNGQVSLPLTAFDWLAKGRYLNGEAVFDVTLANGVLFITAREIKVKGSALPESFMNALRAKNLAEDTMKDPKTAEAFAKLESIQVKDSRVTVKAKPPN